VPERAGPADLDALVALEAACFDPPRRASRRSLARSLRSPRQEVWVVRDGGVVAALVVWRHRRLLRIYSLAVLPDRQGSGLGRALVAHAEAMAPGRVVLEADVLDGRLVAWYSALGYRVVAERPDFYGPGRPAVRMEKVTGAAARTAPQPR